MLLLAPLMQWRARHEAGAMASCAVSRPGRSVCPGLGGADEQRFLAVAVLSMVVTPVVMRLAWRRGEAGRAPEEIIFFLVGLRH